MRVGVVQISASDDPAGNCALLCDMIRDAAGQGAHLVCTPEVSNCVSRSRAHQRRVLRSEAEDETLAAVRALAADLGVWVALGSLAVLTDDPDGRFANRSFLVGPDGQVAARYDKIHMFDVDVTPEETFRESDGFRPGDRAVLARTPLAALGLTVCYDLRFAALYRALAKAGAEVLLVPAAFSPVTGAAHWEVLLRARAIETGCFVVAAAQTGQHAVREGGPRQTHGHAMVVAPWGEVLLDAGTAPGLHMVDLDLAAVAQARGRVPSLTHDRPFAGP